MGVSTIHGAESFYEFLRPSHREKKAFVCNGSACMCAGTQEPLKRKNYKISLEKIKLVKCFVLVIVMKTMHSITTGKLCWKRY